MLAVGRTRVGSNQLCPTACQPFDVRYTHRDHWARLTHPAQRRKSYSTDFYEISRRYEAALPRRSESWHKSTRRFGLM